MFRKSPYLRSGHGIACAATVLLASLPSTAQETATEPALEQVIVSASRSEEDGSALALSWSKIDDSAIRDTAAVHINQLMQRSAGVWISRGNGQESLPSLRSPVLTGAGGCGAFYMAWDGISLRAPGFCNLNQLFDVNSEQAGAVEVIRGPGTAVYGANALHGVINTLTPEVGRGPRQRFALEGGPNDYYRLRGEIRSGDEQQAFGVFFNGVSDGGFKHDSGYDQQKLTVRHEVRTDEWHVTSAVEATNLNQETAGFVTGFEAYRDPESRRLNPNPEAYRDSYAIRAYSRWENTTDGRTLSITPYARKTDMEFLQHFLPWQPVEKNGQDSVGLRLSLRERNTDFGWQVGVDTDFTDAYLLEVQDEPFSPNQPEGVHYDYDVDALSLGAYAQGYWLPAPRWRLSAGVRAEYNRYDYSNRTEDGSACGSDATNCRFFRPADREDSFDNGSLNLGASFALGEEHWLYLRAANGFRPPQAAELYRLQSGQEVADLDSESMLSLDVGVRGLLGGLRYDVGAFGMRKRDVIFQDADRQNISGARTRHEGLEFSAYWQGDSGWYAGIDATLARHRYDSNPDLLGSRLDIKGNDIDTAPRRFGSARVGRQWALAAGGELRGELEWVHMGRYYLDPDNLHEYEGHDLLNLRMTLLSGGPLSASLRVTNLLDEEYAERADFGFGSYRYFVGEPRGAYLEIAWTRR